MSLRLALTFFVACSLLACAEDDPVDYQDVCDPDHRLAANGQIGPIAYQYVEAEPWRGRMGSDFFKLLLESGDDPHLIAFTSRGSEGVDIRTHLRTRLDSGAANAATFDLATRPDTVPCDTAEGVLCAAYGIDTNNDGRLNAGEVAYPIESGTITFSEVSGNEMAARFSIRFAAQVEGVPEEGGDNGGSLEGCFVLYPTPDVSFVQ